MLYKQKRELTNQVYVLQATRHTVIICNIKLAKHHTIKPWMLSLIQHKYKWHNSKHIKDAVIKHHNSAKVELRKVGNF